MPARAVVAEGDLSGSELCPHCWLLPRSFSCRWDPLAANSQLCFRSLPPPRLKPLDVEFMKRLHEKVNVIPLIAKADTLTPEECQRFKKQVGASRAGPPGSAVS